MAAKKGLNFILEIDTTGTPTYVQVGGLRSNGVTINNEAIDTTSMDSNHWREILDEAGVRSVSIAGSGVAKYGTPLTTLRAAAISGTLQAMRVTDEDGNTFTGSFKLTSFEETGEYNGAVTYSLSLESSGAVTYTAA